MKKMCKNNQKTGFNDIFLKNIEKNVNYFLKYP